MRTTGNSHGALEYSDSNEDRPSWPWPSKDGWIVAPREMNLRAGNRVGPGQHFGDRDILFRDIPGWLDHPEWWWMQCEWDLGYNWEPGGPHQQVMAPGMTVWQGAETGLLLASACHTVTGPVHISIHWEHELGLGRAASRCVCATDFFQHFLFSHSYVLLLGRQNSSYPVDRW